MNSDNSVLLHGKGLGIDQPNRALDVQQQPRTLQCMPCVCVCV